MDRLFLRLTAIILFCLAALWGRTACAEWLVEGDGCDPEARAGSWSVAEKMETRERVWAACKSTGASDLYCRFWDAVIVRESWGGIASAVCTKGRDADGRGEYGVGPLCLSLRWHSDKWPGDDEDPAFSGRVWRRAWLALVLGVRGPGVVRSRAGPSVAGEAVAGRARVRDHAASPARAVDLWAHGAR